MTKRVLEPTQARSGRLGRPVLIVLLASTILAVLVVGIILLTELGSEDKETPAQPASQLERVLPDHHDAVAWARRQEPWLG